jgi:hypothetical protein
MLSLGPFDFCLNLYNEELFNILLHHISYRRERVKQIKPLLLSDEVAFAHGLRLVNVLGSLLINTVVASHYHFVSESNHENLLLVKLKSDIYKSLAYENDLVNVLELIEDNLSGI